MFRPSKRILIVKADYYKEIAENLFKGATQELEAHVNPYFEIKYDSCEVPGSFEIPYTINRKKNYYDGFIALGCIIRGETYHFELISNEVTRKIMDISVSINKPIGFGILTCENIEQALERSDPLKRNKGAEAAVACWSLLIKFYGQ